MSLLFVGGGNMATALIGGLVARGRKATDVRVIEPAAEQRARLAQRFAGIDVLSDAQALGERAVDIVVLAVKPQQMRDAVRPLVPFLGAAGAVVLSIAAGIRLEDLRRWLGGYARLVRAMPNTPALIGKGIAGLYAAPEVDSAGRTLAAEVLSACGEVLWVEREAMLDAMTGLSGSGPAYVFYFIEAFERAATELGFAPSEARRLAYATFSGAVALAQGSEHAPAVLRAQVTSKGGTTERALSVMEGEGVAKAIVAAIEAAAERARELGEAMGRD